MTLRFGTDGVRGVANVDLTPELVVALGRAAAEVLGTDGVPFVIGRDTRRSGPMLEGALVAGITAAGSDVLLAGVVPTPGVAFECRERNAPGAVISASHNPFPDNGIKFFAAGGVKLNDAQERAVEAALTRILGTAPPPDPSGAAGLAIGTVRVLEDAAPRYVAHVVHILGDGDERHEPLDGVHVVVDCGNGAASAVGPAALRALGAHVTVLHDEPDGANINAGCGSTDPSELQARVVAAGAAAGLAFDGDADRVIAVDAAGTLIDGDQILAMCAIDLHERGLLHGDAIAVTVMSNLGLRQALARHAIGIVETAVGDRAVLEALAEHSLALGGEQSGHVIFADHATTGDGVLTGAFILALVARSGRSLAELAVVTRLPQVLENVRVADRSGLDTAADFWAAVAAAEVELGAGGRVLVRPSGTEPVVRIMVEAPTDAEARALVARLHAALVAALGPV